LSTKITDKIKTFQDACKISGIDPDNALPYKTPSSKDEEDTNAYCMIKIIARALNEGWEPDWSDTKQYKYFPYFEIKANKQNPSGSGFAFSDCDFWLTGTNVGSRLCFRTSDLALYAATQFEDIYKNHILIMK